MSKVSSSKIENVLQQLTLKYNTASPSTKIIIAEAVELLSKQIKIDKKYLAMAVQLYIYTLNNKREKKIKDDRIIVNADKPKLLGK